MKRTKGISLIVLVVTIIVMIIIAGAIIISLTQTNVIDQAEYARERHNITVLEENLRLERQNILLEKHGTVKDEDIKIETILNVTEEDAINIATANSIPANMPAGTYYEIDGNRYATKTRETEREIALASRGIDRENKVLTDTYVVNDNLDVYYIISGTIADEIQEIDDEKVIAIFNSAATGSIDIETMLYQLKQELHIDKEVNVIFDIMYPILDENYENVICYFYDVDRMYLATADLQLVKHINNSESEQTHNYMIKIEQIRNELEAIFVGKTKSEIESKINEGTVKRYILDNCNSIKDVKIWEFWKAENFITGLVFEYDDREIEDFCGYNTINFVYDENDVCVQVFPSAGA